MIAGANRAITKRAGLFFVLRTFFRTKFARLGARFEVSADDGRIKAITRFKLSVSFDLLSNGGRVFADKTSDSGF